jgi:predicted Zn-dependent protease
MGGMIEVMFNGCLGYAATNSLILSSLQNAPEIAYQQALAASEFWIYPFRENTRPKVVGEYNSPLFELLGAISPGKINKSLIRLCRKYKN